MALLRILCLALGLAVSSTAHAAAGNVSIVAGTEDPVQITQGDKRHQWFRLMPGEDRLSILAEGPVVLAVRLRVLRATTTKGVLRIYRDEGPFSDNPYELSRDPEVVVETSAAAEQNAASEERMLHLPVPEGSHRFDLAPLHGGPVVLRVTKTKKFDASLAPAPERAVTVVRSEPVVQEEPAPAPPSAAPPAKVVTQPPALRATPMLEVAPIYEEVEEVDPTLLSPDLAFRQRPPEAPVRTTGFALGLRGGVWAFAQQGRVRPAASEGFVAARDLRPTGALELAWDFTPAWSVVLDGSFVATTREALFVSGEPQQVRHDLLAIPVGVGFARLVPLGKVAALRLKLLASGAYVDVRSAMAPEGQSLGEGTRRTGLAWGGLGAVALEVKAGPGRVSLEARAQMLSSSLRLAAPPPDPSLETEIGALYAGSVLLGYRLEL